MISRATRAVMAIATAMAVVGGSAATANAASISPGPAMSPRIIGGQVVDQSSTPTPWFAHLTTSWGGHVWGLCGATVIGSQWLLTAAHCVLDPTGKLRLDKSYVQIDPPNGEDGPHVSLDRVIHHSKFRFRTFRNDVALLHTSTPMDAKPIPFAGSGANPAAQTPLQVFGFGSTRRTSERQSPNLRQATVKDLAGPNGECGRFGGDYIKSSMLCAGTADGSKDSCAGDSGGTLLTLGEDRIQVGIVSWGNGCASRRYPGLYTRVPAYAGWITGITGIPAHG